MNLSPRWAIFGSIAVSVTFVMELTLVPLLLPAIQQQFGLSILELAWVFNSYGLAVALGVLVGGWLGDAFNIRRVFSTGVLFFAVGSAVVAFSQAYETILIGRVLQGFGGGVFSPLIPILLTRLSPKKPGKILIIWGSVAGYVAALAPLFYGGALTVFGWNLAFLIFAIFSVVALGIVLSAPTRDDRTAEAAGSPSYFQLLSSPNLLLLFGYIFCTYGTITYYLFRLPLWLSDSGFSVATTGLALSMMWLSFSVVSTLLRNKVDEPHVRGILLVAPILIASGFALGFVQDQFLGLMASSILVGSGLACSNAPSTQLVLKFAPIGSNGLAASLDITFARLGGVATVAVLSQQMIDYTLVSIFVMAVFAVGCAWISTKRLHSTEEIQS